jgi:hypothetical protein
MQRPGFSKEITNDIPLLIAFIKYTAGCCYLINTNLLAVPVVIE